ncbi:unnamed protein product [Adineta steineri]|uniref:Exocyst complex component 8 n=1 Tax=Adineta steineri TaxID=433720 RepID=A0A816BGY8_9BILA|nr:unnamed protein product [Adineta steineri]CAF1611266.1 unnamed protein product [Adineta steineri]
MEYTDADPSFRARLLEPKFEPESFIGSIASQSIGSTDLVNMKRRMYLIASEAKMDLKQNIYRNHTKFIETAKQVSSLESEVYQLHTLLADEQQLLNTVKELLTIEDKPDASTPIDADSWQSLLHHCESLGLVSTNLTRRLIYSGKLLEVKFENVSSNQHYKTDEINKSSTSHLTSPCYGLLFNDYFIITKSTNIRSATAYDVDQVIKLHKNLRNINDNQDGEENKQYSPAVSIQIINVKDDIIRNSFSIKYNLDTITLMCKNAQIKKQWVELLESTLQTDTRRSSVEFLLQTQQEQVLGDEFFSEEWIKNTQENLTILLAERNYDQALVLILQARKYSQEFLNKHEQQLFPLINTYMKSVQEQEQELRKLIEKEILNICERGCSTNLLKHYYHRIRIIKRLGYVPKAW